MNEAPSNFVRTFEHEASQPQRPSRQLRTQFEENNIISTFIEQKPKHDPGAVKNWRQFFLLQVELRSKFGDMGNAHEKRRSSVELRYLGFEVEETLLCIRGL